jgi:aldehyde:ferredoxin oxidoreductase
MYAGTIARINLTDGKIRKEKTNREWARKYIGGKGLGFRYLYEELEGSIDPLSQKNKIMLFTGPFAGTSIPLSGRVVTITKSPHTGTILDSYAGGAFAPELKFAGYDGIIIEGRSEKPVYLFIENETIELKDASELWGKGTHETETILKRRHGDVSVMSCGQAGENLVKFACLTTEYFRHAGRGGCGAVFGSKNLKAVAVSGSKDVTIPRIRELVAFVNALIKEDILTDTNLWAKTDGTSMIVEMSNNAHILPTHNFQRGSFEKWEAINAESIRKNKKRDKACFACPLGCAKFQKMDGARTDGPEYETLGLCGSNCGIGELATIVSFNEKCDDFGLDSMSTGDVTAFACECTEKGIVDLEVRFDDAESYLKMPERIAMRRGVATDLAEGTRFCARKYGVDYACEVKGLEYPAYDPRGSVAMALAYATSDRGACHLRAWPVANEAFGDIDPFTTEGKAALVVTQQNDTAAKFSLILCDFWACSPENQRQLLNFLVDTQYNKEEFGIVGERIWNLARLFNAREGFSRKDDYLPKRITTPLADSGKLLKQEDFEFMLQEYYSIRGWDENGIPTKEKIGELMI